MSVCLSCMCQVVHCLRAIQFFLLSFGMQRQVIGCASRELLCPVLKCRNSSVIPGECCPACYDEIDNNTLSEIGSGLPVLPFNFSECVCVCARARVCACMCVCVCVHVRVHIHIVCPYMHSHTVCVCVWSVSQQYLLYIQSACATCSNLFSLH